MFLLSGEQRSVRGTSCTSSSACNAPINFSLCSDKGPGRCIYLMPLVWFAKMNRFLLLHCAGLFPRSPWVWFPVVPSHVIGILWGCVAACRERKKSWGLRGKLPAWAAFSLSNHWGKLSALVKIQKFGILSCKIGLPTPLLMNKSAVLWNTGLGFYTLIKNLLMSLSEAVLWLI